MAYIRVAPDSHIARITVQCADESPAATRATVSYVFTGLSEQGNAVVAQYTEAHFQRWIKGWEVAINGHLGRSGQAS